jgi:hypothetical protein
MKIVGIFCAHMECIMSIWYISWSFGNFMVIWYAFQRFGKLCQEKSGNHVPHTSFCFRSKLYTPGETDPFQEVILPTKKCTRILQIQKSVFSV